MRLIDVDKIEINEECTFSGKGIKAFLDAIPTAYDVDKVVERLEALKRKSKNHMDIILDDESSYPCEYNVADLAEQRIKAFETAIDIVKSGGIE